jgi:hypothetical protein
MRQIEKNVELERLAYEKQRCQELKTALQSGSEEFSRLKTSFNPRECESFIDTISKMVPESQILTLYTKQIQLAQQLSTYSITAQGDSRQLSGAASSLNGKIKEFSNLITLMREEKTKLLQEYDREASRASAIAQHIEVDKQELKNLAASFAALDHQTIIAKAKTLIPDSQELTLFLEQISRGEQLLGYVIPQTDGTTAQLSQVLANLKNVLHEFSGLIAMIQETKVRVKDEGDVAFIHQKETDFKAKEWTTTGDGVPQVRVNVRMQEIYEQILEFILAQDSFAQIQAETETLIANPGLDEKYKIELLNARLAAIKVVGVSPKEDEELANLRRECELICTMIGRGNVALPDSLETLRALHGELQEQLQQKSMAEYIAQSMSEVMEETGYNILSQEILDNATQQIERNLYDVSTNSVLNVSTSDSGAVMFEVLARKDGDVLTSVKKAAVKADMDRFCPDYALIKAKLAEKGVELTEEKLHPADEKYVRAVDVEQVMASDRRVKTASRKKVLYHNEGD